MKPTAQDLVINNELYDTIEYFSIATNEGEIEYYIQLGAIMDVKPKWAKRFASLTNFIENTTYRKTNSDRDLNKLEVVDHPTLGLVATAHNLKCFMASMAMRSTPKLKEQLWGVEWALTGLTHPRA